ncbi:MAG: cofactor-independent phosphoglycerate mutase [Candidatus Latescibacterota bacterium]
MKYLVLVPDGAADYPLEALGGKTPLEVAHTPNMDRLAREGCGGTVCMIPPERHPGSDVGNLEIFGYDTRIHYTGRSPLEAASMGVDLGPDGVAFRLNTIHRQGDTLVDYSAGHISTEEASALVQSIAAELGRPDVRFYPGVSYRHLLVFDNGPEGLVSYPPHDIMGQSVSAHLPSGEGEASIRALMEQAEPILAEHPVNKRRAERGEPTANAIWLWGSGRALKLKSLTEKFGFSGGVISAVDLVRGIGRSAGLSVVEVPGITGYLDTNYEGKAQHALDVLARDNFVYVHVEAPDEAGHNGDPQAKVQAINDFDARVVGPILDGLDRLGPSRILMTPDHPTPIALRTHSRDAVPFVLWGEGIAADGLQGYGERLAAEGSLHLEHGHWLVEYLRGMRPLQ